MANFLFAKSSKCDSIEIDSLKANVITWRDVIFPVLNNLPECPSLKILKIDINVFISSLWTRDRDFVIAALEFIRLQTNVTYYIIEAKRIRRASPELKGEDALKEIEPKNERERRAMILLRILKLHPNQAMDVPSAQKAIEGAEGVSIDPTVARRAMAFLAQKYEAIISEKIGGKYRIRLDEKFSQKATGQGVQLNQDFQSTRQGVFLDSERQGEVTG